MRELEKLNEEQKKAVLHTEGAVLVFAGAGSGKTRVLTHRIVYLIDELKVPAWSILAITFTNKATKEMKQRLVDMLGENDVWVSTFHSLCVKILHRYAEKLGYGPNFTIFDESASKKILQRVMREKHLDDDDRDSFAYHISKAKNDGKTSDEYFADIRAVEKDAMLICEVYDAYQYALKDNNAMDFDDLLINCYKLLQTNDEAREYYQNKFKYIHVDEFQDTNTIQFEIVKILASKWKNLFAVGDDDQSIYGWRGANIRNILEFDKAFPDVTVYKLEQNYRSSQEILDCANRLIKNNKSRTPKTLFSEKKSGVKVEFQTSSTEYEEVDKVVDHILYLKRYQGYQNSDFAVLVRNNALTRLFETNFKKAGIKYKVFGGFKFFDRKEILDVIAYMRILVNHRDTEAITRVINFPARGIGDTTVEKLIDYAKSNDETLYDVIMDIEKTDLTAGIKNKIIPFRDLLGELQFRKGGMNLTDFVEELVAQVGFERYYRSTGKEDDENRWENIEEFLTFLSENYKDDQDTSLEEFLQTLALDNDKDEEDDFDTVVIATMHAAKGLEFRVVFIVACEEGIIPSAQSLREANGVEEERRVMYVAVTRAEERLYISAVKGVRRKYNRTESVMPSRFFAEAKGEPVVPIGLEKRNRYIERYDDDYENAIPKTIYPDYNAKQGSNAYSQPKPQIQQKPKVYNVNADGFRSGVKVRHKRYGDGTVITVSGSGNATVVSVAFPGLGIKKFALMNAPLEII